MIDFEVTLTEEAEDTIKLIKEWPKRIDKLADYVVHEAANEVLREILKRLPRTKDMRAYRDALQVVRVLGTTKGEFVYTVRANPRRRRVRKVDAQKTVLYVQARRRMRRASPAAAILERYNPWTLDTIPLIPPKSQAKIVSRKVRPDEAQRVAEARQKDRRYWKRDLSLAGVRVASRLEQIQPAKSAKVVSDAAFEAVRIEFGVGVQPHPHWRPSLRRVMKLVPKMAKKHPELIRYMTELSATAPRLPRAKHVISERQARKYMSFQNRLGLKVGGG